nr:MAG TPA: hypothetical protein [Caudoviricetes sp.]DAM21079.1 MAG TPA: hypothetical protein [Caudoviricetes sp.]
MVHGVADQSNITFSESRRSAECLFSYTYSTFKGGQTT